MLLAQAARLRATAWARQKALGVEQIPSNDFSLYDHVLDATVMLGAIPPAYGWNGGPVSFDTYFAMARGRQSANPDEHGHAQAMPGSLPAMEMTNGDEVRPALVNMVAAPRGTRTQSH